MYNSSDCDEVEEEPALNEWGHIQRTLATSEDALPPWPPPLECLDLEAVDISDDVCLLWASLYVSGSGSQPFNF